jgi:hypothetical protein
LGQSVTKRELKFTLDKGRPVMALDLDSLSDEEYYAVCRAGKARADAMQGVVTNEELVAGGAVDTTPAAPDSGEGVIIVGLGSTTKERGKP